MRAARHPFQQSCAPNRLRSPRARSQSLPFYSRIESRAEFLPMTALFRRGGSSGIDRIAPRSTRRGKKHPPPERSTQGTIMPYEPHSHAIGARDIAAAWTVCLIVAGAGLAIPASAPDPPAATEKLAHDRAAPPPVDRGVCAPAPSPPAGLLAIGPKNPLTIANKPRPVPVSIASTACSARRKS
jgi:hypothetical protein